ncbi:MAG TPA: LPS assembly lipoprotein LptE [Rhizomicrobium sp.]|jgi:LPS-assembly lipoprotein
MKVFATAAVLASALLLSACGFRPLYGMNGAEPGAQALFSSIYVETDDTELVGYELRNAIMDLMHCTNDPRAAKYRLRFTVRQTREGVTIAPDAAITRYDYTLNVNYTLEDAHSGAVITKGTESTLSAFDVVSSPYSTLVAQQSAQKTASQDVASRLQIDLAVYFNQHAQR